MGRSLPWSCATHTLSTVVIWTNPVILAVCKALVESSIAALRFNFRGVGDSEGSHGGGVAERDDVKAALDFVSSIEGIDTGRLGLSGYSFGSRVALPVALKDERVKRLALISPSLGADGVEQLVRCAIPWLVLIGDRDTMVPRLDFKGQLVEAHEYQVILGADHFWRGYESEVGQRVAEFFTRL
jgi:alpha/beta superfamily hydrolase